MQGRRLNAGRLWMNLKQLYGFLPVMLKCFKFGYNIPWAWKDIPGMMHVNE
ncbi:hypothetical protein CLOBOL_02980 [Enterocloster bolteae ATCC BAA-613]|nr:hypothetical protein CLOBOL_02980 [Enterocloster bolteae ATCC BAA-613]